MSQNLNTKIQQNLGDMAYLYLLNRLRQGIAPEERLVESEVASQLGVSRVPVRQALLQLVSEGYLVSTARGYRVPTLSSKDIRDVFELRLLLEPRAAALAARDMRIEQLCELDRVIQDAKSSQKSNDQLRLFTAGIQFRQIWIGAVHNDRLAETITRYGDQVLAVRRATLRDTEAQRIVISGYEELRNAFSTHDSLGAQDTMVRFVLSAEEHFASLAGLPHFIVVSPRR